MADRRQAVLVLLACSAVLATGSAVDNLAAHNASAELLGAGAAKLLLPSANTSDSSTSYELAYARAQLYRVSALLPDVQLRPGVLPVNCSCVDFHAGNCFAAGCRPCDAACHAPTAQGPLRPGRGPLGTGLLCQGACLPCCSDPAQVPDTTCALPPGGCPE